MATQTKKKLYPFSLTKHAHDIEFRYNRLKNLECDYFAGEIELTNAEFNKMEEELELVTKAYETILNTFSDGRIVWVDGETLGILKECVLWAETERDSHKSRRN